MPIWAVTDHFQSLSGIFNHPSWAISGPKLAAKRYKTRGICAFWGEIGMSPLRLTFEIRLGKNEREGGGGASPARASFLRLSRTFFFGSHTSERPGMRLFQTINAQMPGKLGEEPLLNTPTARRVLRPGLDPPHTTEAVSPLPYADFHRSPGEARLAKARPRRRGSKT